MQRFCREVMAWKSLHHPNVLPLLGVTMAKNQFVMVSEWMAKGNINEFVKEEPSADRLELVCFYLSSLSLLMIGNNMVAIAQTSYKGVSLYA